MKESLSFIRYLLVNIYDSPEYPASSVRTSVPLRVASSASNVFASAVIVVSATGAARLAVTRDRIVTNFACNMITDFGS